jgi:High potential iron-sulfur protein
MPHETTRRHLLQTALATSALLSALDTVAFGAQSGALAPLDTKDSAASALGFVTENSSAGSNPLYKKGQHCASCAHYQGTPSDATAGCNIYPGRSVPANGWCSAWGQRPG